jgi:nucleoside-diphosphate-sugar epimerase
VQTAVLIGGGGFIGSHLAAHLAAQGIEVTALDLAFPHPMPDGVVRRVVDIRAPIRSTDLPRRPGLVVNLAAVHREPGHEPHEYYDANVTGGQHTVQLCEELEATDVVFISSISVYGPTETPVSEATPPAPVTDYGRSKLQAEDLHRAWQQAGPDRWLTTVRPAVTFGRGEGGNFTRLGGALQGRRFVYPGRKDTLKANGYVKDLVRTIQFMHRKDPGETLYNFCYPEPHRLEAVCEAFCRVLDRRPPRLMVPTAPMLLAGTIGDRLGPLGKRFGLSKRRIEKLVSSTNVRADRLAAEGYEYAYDLDAALRDWFAEEPVGRFV